MKQTTLIAVLMFMCSLSLQGQHTRKPDRNPPAPKHAQQPDHQENDDEDKRDPLRPDEIHHPVLWHDPGRISSLDLYLGQGGKQGQPVPPFQFEKENRRQSTPKFEIRDAKDEKWKVKLGSEARPEVVTTRLLWAVGYFVEDEYLLPTADVSGLHLRRGKKFTRGEEVRDAQFSRKPDGEKKIAIWKWKKNVFTGTRELNGLRVMMALLNSWDLKDENNSVYEDKKTGGQLFLVSDTGSSLGRNGLHFINTGSKDNARAFAKSKFIEKVTPTEVSFGTPKPSPSLLLETLGFGLKQFLRRNSMLWIGRHIPRQDAHWIGGLLGQLTHQQIVDAFRAGGYPPRDIDEFVPVMERRIRELQGL